MRPLRRRREISSATDLYSSLSSRAVPVTLSTSSFRRAATQRSISGLECQTFSLRKGRAAASPGCVASSTRPRRGRPGARRHSRTAAATRALGILTGGATDSGTGAA